MHFRLNIYDFFIAFLNVGSNCLVIDNNNNKMVRLYQCRQVNKNINL